MKVAYRTEDNLSFIVTDDEGEMGQVADLTLGRAHPPLLVADILANGGGIWLPVADEDDVPDLNHLVETAYFDRSRSKPTLGQNVLGPDEGVGTTTAGSPGTVQVGKVGYRGASFDGAPASIGDE